ncbi:MAG: hypothetical protein H8K07_02685 [Nitrospira sp.]|nr:hypothetical protein [Nitrospira sp.]
MSAMIRGYRLLPTLGIATCLSLTSCITPAQVAEYPNQQRMVGRSKSAILSCAGIPKKEITEAGLTYLRYYREAPVLEESHPVGKGSFATVRHGCWATVILSENRVIDVHYRFVPPTFDASNDCEEIFEPCLQQ